MLFSVLAQKAYARNLQYRSSHALKMLASAIIGFIYASLWIGIGQDHTLGTYGTQGMISYIAFNQAALWVVNGATNGLGLQESVRSGQIALDLIRPVHLFYVLVSKEWGHLAYQFVYKTIPILLIYVITVSLRLPTHFQAYLYALIALALAAYINICINYFIGICSLWTTESRWMYWLHFAFFTLLSGFLIPVDWLPLWLQGISHYTPYPYLQYYPTRIFLEMESTSSLIGSILWCLLLTLLSVLATRWVRRKVEIQGG